MLSGTELSYSIIEKAKNLGASVAGIASVKSLKNSPSHTIYPKIGMNLNEEYDCVKGGTDGGEVSWPEDAMSVVVIGVEHSALRPDLDWWDGRGTPGNRILIKINNQLSEWIEKTFDITTYRLSYLVEKGGIFLKDAAVEAGLGCIGKNNLVITPQYGPRIRFRALLLNKEAAPTAKPEFNPCENCEQPCRRACPVKVFHKTVYSAENLGQSALPGIDGTYNRVTCNRRMEIDINEAARKVAVDDKHHQEIKKFIDEFESRQQQPGNKDGETMNIRVQYCRLCELSCPVGSD